MAIRDFKKEPFFDTFKNRRIKYLQYQIVFRVFSIISKKDISGSFNPGFFQKPWCVGDRKELSGWKSLVSDRPVNVSAYHRL